MKASLKRQQHCPLGKTQDWGSGDLASIPSFAVDPRVTWGMSLPFSVPLFSLPPFVCLAHLASELFGTGAVPQQVYVQHLPQLGLAVGGASRHYCYTVATHSVNAHCLIIS